MDSSFQKFQVSVPVPYFFGTGNAWWAFAVFIGALIAFGLLLSKNTPSVNLNQRAALPAKPAQKPIVPVVQPKALAPKIVKVELQDKPVDDKPVQEEKPAPTLEPKALALPVLAEPVAEEKIAAAQAVEQAVPSAPVEEVVSAPAPVQESQSKTQSIDDTFEAYRQAMLASGPRQMEMESRAAIQSKAGHGNTAWRNQISSLRQSFQEESAADFLERTNTSINDRMVAIFDSVKA